MVWYMAGSVRSHGEPVEGIGVINFLPVYKGIMVGSEESYHRGGKAGILQKVSVLL